MEQIIEAIIPVVGIGVLYVLYIGAKYIRERTENERLKAALSVVEKSIYSAVCGLTNQADSLRDENGKLSAENAKYLKHEAIRRAISRASAMINERRKQHW
ncbi:MAG: hypothetical protein OMM_14090 [Candidatus Magnetoglobus multicellularis str. Araruama]|uniref:Uncharacterized protein n=1 Tax=Candidatus Magnetoglobus multicellularis str. Araruama TaxID=890399 RepID=A0A1V1NSK6_9BACT|nr:MAG: hypothetical protein OMM_14090 [Candidatus Magnetoglobus multicellularis str. Araruama]